MLRRHAKWKFTAFLFVLFCMRRVTSETVQPMGSVLFDDHGFTKKCFHQSDIALLSARLKFQNLLPNEGEASMLNDDGLTAIIRYFYGVNEIIEKMSESNARQLLQQSFYDLLGSYLKHQILPKTKFSFYSGNVTFSVAMNAFNLYERCKELLDTNGNGWSDPIADFSDYSFTIEPLDLKRLSSENETSKACVNLAMSQNEGENDEDMLVPLPKLETEDDELLTIRLPFKRKRIFNVNAKDSSFILLRYFVTVSQCYSYQGMNQNVFNRKFKGWIMENVLPFLDDDKLYPTFGAVLRILETIKEPGDGVYQGSKRKSARKRINTAREKLVDEDYESFALDFSSDAGWWIRVGMIAATGCTVLFLLICLCVRLCRGKSHDSSFKNRIKRLLKSNTHIPERDEFHPYDKASSRDRGITFENERQTKSRWFSKKRKPKSKERFELPLLGNATESEDEIVLHDSSNEASKKSKKHSQSKAKFVISESSDEAQRSKKSPSILKLSSKPN